MLLEKQIRKGTMRPVKKVIGGILFILGLCFLFAFQYTITKLRSFNLLFLGTFDIVEIIFGLLLITAGYFLFISGRR